MNGLTWKDRIWYAVPWFNVAMAMANSDTSKKVTAIIVIYDVALAAGVLIAGLI